MVKRVLKRVCTDRYHVNLHFMSTSGARFFISQLCGLIGDDFDKEKWIILVVQCFPRNSQVAFYRDLMMLI